MPTAKAFGKFVLMFIAAGLVVNNVVRPLAQKANVPLLKNL